MSKANSAKPTVTKTQLIQDLKNIGLKEGDHVSVVLSLKSIGHVEGGPNEFINALLEVVGPSGTIMVNTFTYLFPLSAVPTEYVFDHNSTSCYTGLIPEIFRKRADSIRSKHPGCSVSAIGKLATYLTEDHNEKSDPFLPFSKLTKIGGKFLSIGIGDRLVAIRHEAQSRAGLSKVVPEFHAVKYKTGQESTKLFIMNHPGCTRSLYKLGPNLTKKGILKAGKIGFAKSYIADAKELLTGMSDMLKNDPTLSLCDEFSCIWCRELERRMKLYNKIEKPFFFQRNIIVLRFLELINRIRLNRFSSLIYQKGKVKVAREADHSRIQTIKNLIKDVSVTLKRKISQNKKRVNQSGV